MHKLVLLALMSVTILLAACGGEPTARPAATAGDAQQSPLATPAPAGGEGEPLRLALLPILDVLPLHVAQQNGYFELLGLQVETVPVKSAQERDTLIQTGQADGMVTDLVALAVFDQAEAQIKAVRVASAVSPGAPQFRILARPGSSITAPAELAGVEIGISQNTVIEYITDRILERAGLAPEQIVVQEVSAIPVRFELLINGEIEAATLPDPLASGAIAAGAVLVADDTAVADLSQSILIFRTEILESRPDDVRRFLQAWEMAVQELNANPDKYKSLLIEVGRVPESIQGSFQMAPYPAARVPTPEQVADAVQWAMAEGLVANDVPYERMVDASFLP